MGKTQTCCMPVTRGIPPKFSRINPESQYLGKPREPTYTTWLTVQVPKLRGEPRMNKPTDTMFEDVQSVLHLLYQLQNVYSTPRKKQQKPRTSNFTTFSGRIQIKILDGEYKLYENAISLLPKFRGLLNWTHNKMSFRMYI